jgi:hypothetical protein
MVKPDLEIIQEYREEIIKYQILMTLTKQIINLNENKDKYGNNNYLSDFNEELENHIETYKFSIKERLFGIYQLEVKNK